MDDNNPPSSQNLQNSQNFSSQFFPPNFQNSQYTQFSRNFQYPPNALNFSYHFIPSNMFNFSNTPTFSSTHNFSFHFFPTNIQNLSQNIDNTSQNDQDSATEMASLPDFQIPPYSTQPLADEEETEAVPRKQHELWSIDDDMLITSAWLTISTDSIVGNAEQQRIFWMRITDYYKEHRLLGRPERTQIVIEGH
ncbi:hypothetical protein Scep_004456 [Stephania cephalantha]|uniref:Uncharacterized protein n=1 Tax=Stephania cephalantha TaxID=152367 RepID=A0AAP0PVD8_9MAGN